MAEEVAKGECDTKNGEGDKNEELDCPVCLQPYTYPVRLTCGHIFCFLCIKGVAFRSKRCALCRQDVDLNYFKNPDVVNVSTDARKEQRAKVPGDIDSYHWYYEGRNGWWQYEESSSAELERAHKDGKRSCELQVAGFMYFVDFENMVQFRKTEPSRSRRIKRDLVDAEKKGVAGIRLQHASNERTAQGQGNVACNSNNDPSSSLLSRIQRFVVGSSEDDDDGGGRDGGKGTDNQQQQVNRRS